MLQGSGREPGTGSELLSSRQGELWGRIDPSEGGQTNRPNCLGSSRCCGETRQTSTNPCIRLVRSNLRGHGSTCSQPKHHASTT